METALITIAYLTSAVLFILSLRGLSSQETARSGNTYGMLGMAIAIFATVTAGGIDRYAFIGVALVVASRRADDDARVKRGVGVGRESQRDRHGRRGVGPGA